MIHFEFHCVGDRRFFASLSEATYDALDEIAQRKKMEGGINQLLRDRFPDCNVTEEMAKQYLWVEKQNSLRD